MSGLMRRMRKAQLAASILGLVIAVYLTLYHYAGVPLVCSSQGVINCESVLNSQYAYVLGLPIALFGVVFFAVELGALLNGNLDAILIWNIIGLGAVFYFLYIEKTVGHICMWCTAVHILVIFLVGTSAYEMLRKKEL